MSRAICAVMSASMLVVSMSIVGCREHARPEVSELSDDGVVAKTPSELPAEMQPTSIETEEVAEISESPASQSSVDASSLMAEPAVGNLDTLPIDDDQVEIAASEESIFGLHGDPVRVYLPTKAGPLLIDMYVHVDGRNQKTLFHEMIDDVIADAKDDEGEKLDWPSMFEFIRADPERFGAIMQNVGNNTSELIRRTDSNRNRLVDHDELAKFLFRNNRENVAFRIRGTDYFQSVDQSTTGLFEALDEDNDGVLSKTEIDDASVQILKMDQNVDHQLEVAELGTRNLIDDQVWDRRRTGRHGDVAMDLEGFVDWTLVSYSLANHRLRKPFGLSENVIDLLDKNNDDTISFEEAKGLLSCEPHLRVSVDFAASDSASVRFVSAMPTVRERLIFDQRMKHQLLIADETLQLAIRVVDQSNQLNRVPRDVFFRFDANMDGFLDDSEVPSQVSESFSIEELDVDDDGKLTLSEINRTQAKNAPMWTCQVRGRASRSPDLMFGFLDVDQDGLLSTREIDTTDDRIGSLVTGSIALRASDVPESFALTLVRCDPEREAQVFRRRSSARLTSQLPSWATQMDVNRDGEISASEFIGTTSQFEKIDTDRDGFITQGEIDGEETSQTAKTISDAKAN